MIELTVGNSSCSLIGLSSKQFSDVRAALSYTETKKNRWGYKTITKHLMDRAGTFPSGLMYIVEAFLEYIPHSRVDTRVMPTRQPNLFRLNLGELVPRQEQLEATAAVVTAGRGGVVEAPTGSGKSLLCALIIAALQVPTLVVVPSLALKQQLSSSMSSWFGADAVGRGNPIWVENVQALDPAKPLKGYGAVLIDEVHRSAAATYRTLNAKAWQDVYHRVGLTATFFRSEENEALLLESIISDVVYRLDHSTAVEKGYIVPVEAYVYRLPKVKLKCNGKSWAGVYQELVVRREDRNRLIAHITANLAEAGESTLVLTKQVEHGEEIQRLLAEQGLDVPFAEGKNDANRQLILEFNLREKTTLIGTVGILGEGIDSRPASWVILAGGGKSKGQLMQNVGRTLRLYPGKECGKVVLFHDQSHRWLDAHYKACAKHLRDEYGIVPIELPLPEGIV